MLSILELIAQLLCGTKRGFSELDGAPIVILRQLTESMPSNLNGILLKNVIKSHWRI